MGNDQDYTITFSVDQTPEEVFKAINNVSGWWDGEIKGDTDKVGYVFTYQYSTFHHSKQKVIELIPGKKIVWSVIDGGPTFTKNKIEWKGTKIIFEISRSGNKTEVCFTHKGLVPKLECYSNCTDAWGTIIKGSLRSFIVTGKGQPL